MCSLDNIPSLFTLETFSFRNKLNRSLKKVSLTDLSIKDLMMDVEMYRNNVITLSEYQDSQGMRFKSENSVLLKYNKFNKQNRTDFLGCFNDLMGLRVRLDHYPDSYPDYFRVVDLRNGKSLDDGYRAVHLYYQKDNYSYPIEIQLWCEKDFDFNIWSHTMAYKYVLPEIGIQLRDLYDKGVIKSEDDFLIKLNEIKSKFIDMRGDNYGI